MSDTPQVQSSIASDSSIAKKEADKVISKVDSLVIKTPEDLEQAVALLSQIKTTAKGVTAKKDAIIRPLNLSIGEVRELFREPEQRLSEAEQKVKQAILDYQAKVEAKAQKKAEKIDKKIQDGELTLSQGIDKAAKIERLDTTVQTENGGVQFRKVRKVRILNVAQIPVRYFSDPKVLEALRIAVSKDALAGVEVPGVEVYEESTVAGISK